MPDMINEGMEWLAGQLMDHCSRVVNYRRDGLRIPVNAVVGRTTLEFSDDLGNTRTRSNDRDYIIRAADLVTRVGGTPFTPKAGDTIKDGTLLYEVIGLAGDPEYRESDAFGVMLRIHVKRVD